MRTNFVHLFGMPLDQITSECSNNDLSFQIMPVQEHKVDNNQWYLVYQPVSLKLDNKLHEIGNTCANRIWVDLVINHMANGEGVGNFGSRFNSRNREYDQMDYNDFHNVNMDMDYNDRWKSQNCDLLSLPDLNTGRYETQWKIANALQEINSAQVQGVRIDAAKHISVNDLRGIYDKVQKKSLLFQEVIPSGGITTQEYASLGYVTELGYGYRIRDVFRNRKLFELRNIQNGLLESSKAIITVINHDQERSEGNLLNYRDGYLYLFANYFTLFNDYGMVAIHSGFGFNSFDQSSSKYECTFWENDRLSNEGFHCLHRHPYLVVLMRLRDQLENEKVQFVHSSQNTVVLKRGKYVLMMNIGDNTENVNLSLGNRRVASLLGDKSPIRGDIGNYRPYKHYKTIDNNYQLNGRTVELFELE